MRNQPIPIDNSHLLEKVTLRIESLKLINKNEVNVLDAFGGDGTVWKEVRNHVKDKTINALRIDKKKDKQGMYLKGDNIKYMKNTNFDLSIFDIIDLDAYGSPFNQLEIIFKRKYTGIIHCTNIQVGPVSINIKMLERLGYTDRMVKKSPTLFSRQPFKKMLYYLGMNGVKEIFNTRCFDGNEKNYFYFVLK